MIAIHTITTNNKMRSQNCKLKSNLANYQIKGIVFNQTTSHETSILAEDGAPFRENQLAGRVVRFQSDPFLKGQRIKGLSIQSAT